MPESFRTRLLRWRFNVFPAYRGTGARVRYIAHDLREIVVELPLSWRTRNYVGTIFGGSMYGAVDPMFMIMLIHCLGPGYTVWDKAATIRFLRPGKSTLRATFRLDDAELEAIRAELATKRSIDRVYVIDLVGEDGTPHATVEKTIYVRNDDWSPKDGERREATGDEAMRREARGDEQAKSRRETSHE